ncbi:transglycosylase SLT domain-containing protein [Tropicimonas sp. IMCC34043]|uniref:transglycosylase SLT domain-containing protein n=1 Tax=Tropicimonas sp. IMCC34043 TaxID=2248760 RepID=UPI0013006BD9|nr:transglycosylase SLT domain-containing protein [Tropicimonas sp. IMCC34043]
MKGILALAVSSACICGGLGAGASVNPCLRWAEVAAAETGVPENVLRAIALTESGHTIGGEFSAWPWTVNAAGQGNWFATRGDALAFARSEYDRGNLNFDIGCFQLNYRWHRRNFPSVDAMFDPAGNTRYAAAFLLRLHEELGSWEAAAKAYHSRNPAFSEPYFARLKHFLNPADTPPERQPAPAEDPAPPPGPLLAHLNRIPLVEEQAGRHRLGSLVPPGRRTDFTLASATPMAR